MDLELRMIEQDIEGVEKRPADLVAILGRAAHAAHQAIGALGGNPPRRRLGRQTARHLIAEEHLRAFEDEIGARIDDLFGDRRGAHRRAVREHAWRAVGNAVEDASVESDHLLWRKPAYA